MELNSALMSAMEVVEFANDSPRSVSSYTFPVLSVSLHSVAVDSSVGLPDIHSLPGLAAGVADMAGPLLT